MEIQEFSNILELAENSMAAYEKLCRPVCRGLGINQTAFDILMFLANNPQYQTAGDIVKVRHLKPNLVSFHVERLVQEGYLVREGVPGDRRKVRLLCTEKVKPVVKQGREAQSRFFSRMTQGIGEEALRQQREVMAAICKNVESMLDEEQMSDV